MGFQTDDLKGGMLFSLALATKLDKEWGWGFPAQSILRLLCTMVLQPVAGLGRVEGRGAGEKHGMAMRGGLRRMGGGGEAGCSISSWGQDQLPCQCAPVFGDRGKVPKSDGAQQDAGG